MTKRWTPLLISLLFFSSLDIILPAAGPLSDSFQFKTLTFLIFLFFLGSLIGWGGILGHFIKSRQLTYRLILGSGFLSLSMFLFAFFGFIGTAYIWPLRIILIAGFAGFSLPEFKKPDFHFRIKLLGPILAALLFIFIMIRGAYLFNLIDDAFSYHLYSPWLWWENGRMAFSAEYPMAFLASYWEALFLWAYPLFGSTGTRLYAVFTFCQLLHAVLGFLGVVVLATEILRKLKVDLEWALLAALYGATVYPLLWTAWTAMNDYGIVFWALSAVFLILNNFIFLAGILGGMAIGAKFSAVFIVAYIAIGLFFSGARSVKEFFRVNSIFTLGILIGLFPLFLRNIYYTKNPLFPLLQNIFGRDLMSKTMNYLCFDSLGERFGKGQSFLQQFPKLFFAQPALLLCLILLAYFLWKKKEPSIRYLLCIAALPIFPAVYWIGTNIHDFLYIRYLSPALFFATATPIATLGKRQFKSSFLKVVLLVVLSAGLFFTRPFIPWKLFLLPPYSSDFFDRYQSISAGSCKIWMAENLDKDASIVSIEDDSLFLLPFKRIEPAFHSLKLDPIFLSSTPMEEKIKWLKDNGYRYLYSNVRTSPTYRYKSSTAFYKWMYDNKEYILFRGNDCLILDLQK